MATTVGCRGGPATVVAPPGVLEKRRRRVGEAPRLAQVNPLVDLRWHFIGQIDVSKYRVLLKVIRQVFIFFVVHREACFQSESGLCMN